MTVDDFVIPLERDHLLNHRPGIYSVKKVYQPKDLEHALRDVKSKLESEGPSFMLDHFDKFFSVLVHSAKIKLPMFMQAFETVYKCLDMFVAAFEKEFDKKKEPQPEDKPLFVTITKMLAYLLTSLIKHIENLMYNDMTVLQTKRKKISDKSDVEIKWEDHTDKVLVLIYHWVNLPLEKLWNPPIVDGSFITTIADICYRILERCKAAKDKPLRESIFQILGVLVKKYNFSISCVLKIVQLIKLCDGLALHLGAGIVQLIEETQCTGMMKEIMREVDKATPEQGGTRNIANFLEKIVSLKPELILPILENLTDYLDDECHIMRQCVINILGIVVRDVLTSENLSEEQKTKRNECLNHMMGHIRDSNTFVRVKTLQVWQNLCSEGAVPIAYQNELLEATIFRLNDKSLMVRKQAFPLLRTMLQCNPFAGKLDHEQIANQLAEAKEKLSVLKSRIASVSEPGSKVREEIWRVLLPGIKEAAAKMPPEKRSPASGEGVPDLDAEFEKVRQLLLEKKYEESLGLLMETNAQLPENADLENMDVESREEYLISLIHKVFMDSQEAAMTVGEQGDGDSMRRSVRDKELKKREEEYNAQSSTVKYLTTCSRFASTLATAIPLGIQRMYSTTPSDAIEACSFLGLAYQFKVRGAKDAVRRALCQAFYPDPSVCENLAEVYKELFIADEGEFKSERQQALSIVQTLIGIFKTLESGESPALAKLITTWREKGVLPHEVLQVMWEKFSRKLPDTSPEDSRAALALLTMAAQAEPSIFTENLDVLVTVGLGPWSQTDLLFARDTCRAFTKVKVEDSNPLTCPARLSPDLEIFKKISSLLTEKFPDVNESAYPSFAIEAINAIYHLADEPEFIMEKVLRSLHTHFNSITNEKMTVHSLLLANMCTVVGHVALKEMVHLDMAVYKELKRRNALMEITEKNKKGKNQHNASASSIANRTIRDVETPASASRRKRTRLNSTAVEDSGEEALEGAAADDADAELIQNILEHEVVMGDGILTKFAPVIKDICQHPEIFKDESLQIAATLSLCKMMSVSSIFCRNHLQLLITILERSECITNRVNILVGLADMMGRFPNEIEPWTHHIYGRLRDDSPEVRRACIKMLANLIMREMIRVKGQVSELAVCLVDSEADIRDEVTRFFRELANKGNALYNIIPDILSRLTDPGLNLEEDNFREIIKFILGLVQKEKQIDSMIEKICFRFKLATSERQWRDLAFCLSLFKYNVKGIHRLSDNLDLMKDKVHYGPVLKVLQDIIDHAKKKVEMKAACTELEDKLEKLLTTIDKDVEMPPPASVRKKPKKIRRRF